MSTPMRYRVQKILESAERKNILLTVEDGDLRIKAPKGVLTDEIRGILRNQKSEIIAHLQAEENKRYQREIEEEIAKNPDLCITCMDLYKRDVPATHQLEGFNYCAKHYALQKTSQTTDRNEVKRAS